VDAGTESTCLARCCTKLTLTVAWSNPANEESWPVSATVTGIVADDAPDDPFAPGPEPEAALLL
jgi:hypothetical protein